MLSRNVMVFRLIGGLMKKIQFIMWLYKRSYYPEAESHTRKKIKLDSRTLNKIKFELHLCKYAKKADLK